MVMYRGMPKATPDERVHIGLVRLLPCCNCIGQKTHTEADHLKQGNKRMGHYYVIPLCGECHHKVHLIRHKQRELWEQTNEKLGITRQWPVSKIVPRRVA